MVAQRSQRPQAVAAVLCIGLSHAEPQLLAGGMQKLIHSCPCRGAWGAFGAWGSGKVGESGQAHWITWEAARLECCMGTKCQTHKQNGLAMRTSCSATHMNGAAIPFLQLTIAARLSRARTWAMLRHQLGQPPDRVGHVSDCKHRHEPCCGTAQGAAQVRTGRAQPNSA